MKKIGKPVLVIIAVSLFCLPLMSQTTMIPDNVIKSFSSKFPDAKQVKWDKESVSEYEAEFIMNDKKMSASFDNNGKWMETETKISEKAIPAAIKTTFNNDFKGYKIKFVELSETSDKGKIWEITMEKDEQNMEVAFNEKGKVVKKEMVKDENGGD